jgi:hypothetical protein
VVVETVRQEIGAMLKLGTRLDLSEAIEYMRQHGQSVLLNWGEDDHLWECSWITGGERHTGFANREPIKAVLMCLSIVADDMDTRP